MVIGYGCGREVCAVETKTDGKLDDEPSIQVCGEYCPYHKKIHYCKECEKLWNFKEEKQK